MHSNQLKFFTLSIILIEIKEKGVFTIKKTILKYNSGVKFRQRDAEKLRGYFSNLYTEKDYFHNHTSDSKAIYRMPLIQYKVVEGQLMVIGIEEASELVANEFLKHKEINIGGKKFDNFSSELKISEEELKVTDELYSYRFESIWLPINQKNKRKYLDGELNLDKVLTNHLLTTFKGCKVEADKKIMVKGNFKEKHVKLKNVDMIGFKGDFVTNVLIPEYISLGQRRAIGFGTVVIER